METFSAPVLCPVLIGRVHERQALCQLLDRARNGQGQVALLCGEAGIGKSRLVAEAKVYASEQGFFLFQGNCFQVDSAYPYAPLLDLLRTWVAQTAKAAELNPVILEFARLLPEVALALPGPLPASLPDPEQEKRRLFAALTRFFQEQARQHSVLLIIEDLHWCDDISLEFLLSLARLCPTQPLLFLATYRSDEVQPTLQRFLAQLDRARLSKELRLLPLSHHDINTMLNAMFALPEAEQANLLDLIYPLTEGNPFFVEELLTSLVSSGELRVDAGVWQQKPHPHQWSKHVPVPRSIQDAVQQRMQQLSADASQVVTLAAVAGRRFDFAVLQQVMHCDESELLSLIKELVAAQLVGEVSAEQFAFRHALTQQAVYAGFLARERRMLHRALAEAIEQLYVSTPLLNAYLEDLAYHYYEAGTWEKALEYQQRAGEKDLALYAQRAAIDHFTRALSALQHLPEKSPAALYHLRGQAYETLSEFERALSDYEHALEAARDTQDRLMEWQSVMAIGFLWTGHDYQRTEEWFHRAIDLAEDMADSTLRARSLHRLGNWLMNRGRIQEAQEVFQEVLSLFEAQSDKQGMAETLEMLGAVYYFIGDTARAVNEFFGQAIELFRAIGSQRNLCSALTVRALDSAPETIETTYSSLRTYDECMQDIEEAFHLALQTNSLSDQAFIEMGAVWFLASFGKFGPALTHAQTGLQIATTIEHQEWLAAINGAIGRLYLLLLQPDSAVSHLEPALVQARAIGSMIWIGYLTPYLGLAYTLKREFSRAEATLQTILPRDKQAQGFFERQVAWIWGELALAQGEPNRTLDIAEQLLATTPGNSQQHIPHLLALKGEALLALKRPQEAARALEDAKVGAEQRQAPSILWRIHRSLGQAYHLLKQ